MFHSLFLLVFAVAPGLIWLFFFLMEDKHPEPKRMILKIFFLGMAAALPAALIELLFQEIGLGKIILANSLENYFFLFLQITIGVAFVEEALKYLVVKVGAIGSPEIDEPVDLVMYMIIAALGFATLENVFIFLSPATFAFSLENTALLATFRFVSATFLHALTSGTIGFFLALSFCEIKRRKLLFTIGFSAAVLLHGLYNFSIMNLGGSLRVEIPLFILLGLAIFIFAGIKYLRSIKSICEIN